MYEDSRHVVNLMNSNAIGYTLPFVYNTNVFIRYVRCVQYNY